MRLDDPKTSACSPSELEEAGRVGTEQRGAAGAFVVAGFAPADEIGFLAQRGDAVGVAACDVRRQHRGGRRPGEGVAGGGDEVVEAGAVGGDDEARVGAELAGPHGERADEGLAEVGAAGAQCTVEQEDRVDGAHLGVDRDRLGPASRGGDESCSAGTGSGEADGLDARIGDQRDAEVGPGPEEQREGARRQAGLGDGVGDGAADEFGGAGVGVVAFDDDGAACGERRGGVAAGDGEGQREVGGAEDGDRTERDGALANVGPRRGLAVGKGGVDAGAVPGTLAQDGRRRGGAGRWCGRPRR